MPSMLICNCRVKVYIKTSGKVTSGFKYEMPFQRNILYENILNLLKYVLVRKKKVNMLMGILHGHCMGGVSF